jgi:hypothetical protein
VGEDGGTSRRDEDDPIRLRLDGHVLPPTKHILDRELQTTKLTEKSVRGKGSCSRIGGTEVPHGSLPSGPGLTGG